MNKIPFKPPHSKQERPLQGLPSSKFYITANTAKENIQIEESYKQQAEHKSKEQRAYFIVVIIIIIIFFFLILGIITGHKSTCEKGDLECENYYNDNPMQYGIYH